jgi:hypothetical protein
MEAALKITVCGWKKDHGSKTVADEDLSELRVENDLERYPADRAIIEMKSTPFESENYIRIVRRVEVSLNGAYMLDVRFSLSDVLFLFWTCFKGQTIETFGKATRHFK